MSPSDAYDESPPIQDDRIVRGLRQLAIDPHAEVPAEFHAAVMARAQILPPPRKWPWERVQERLTVWAPAFALGLVLSLGVHVWQSLQAIRPHAPDTRQAAEKLIAGRNGLEPLSIYQFQVRLQHPDALAALVAARPVPQMPRAMVGFTPQIARSTFVRIGILYTDVLAALQSGAGEDALHRLAILTQVVSSLQAPPALVEYLREMQTVLQRQPSPDHTVAQFMALFEPLYKAVYATDPTAAVWVLFQAGAWLENLSLAAAAGDIQAVQQAQALPAVHEALRALHVSQAVLDSLGQVRALIAHQPLTAQDVHAVQVLVDTSKTQLSE